MALLPPGYLLGQATRATPMPRTEDANVAAAAMPVVKDLRNVQLNQYRPELAKAAGYQQSELDRLRAENLVKALEAIAAAAPMAAEYRKARCLMAAGHGPANDASAPAA